MAEDFAADILICGAGAAGLTLAIDLARRGMSLRLIEKMDGPFRGSRGKGIQPRTQEIFEDLGIIDRIFALGGLYPPQREYRAGGSHTDSEVMERQVGVSAVTVIVALLVGGSLLGILGAVLAVPSAAILQVLLQVILDERDRLEERAHGIHD